MSLYNAGIPTGSVNLDIDYLNIKNNFGQLNTSFGVDHIPFSITLNNGYHTNIHLVPFSTIASNPPNNYPVIPPAPVTETGTIYNSQVNDGINPDETLYFLTGGGRNIQLTRNFVPTNLVDGNSFIPGGIIINWGFKSLSGSQGEDAPVIFSQPFTTPVYNVQLTLVSIVGTTSSGNTLSVQQGSNSTTQFRYRYDGRGVSGGTGFVGFYWMAIGT